MRNIGLLLFFLIGALPFELSAQTEPVLLQAEDALELSSLQLDAKNKETLSKLVASRRALLATIVSEEKEERSTQFGTAYTEPKALQEWRAKENEEIRKIVPEDKIKSVEEYAASVKGQLSSVKEQFPFTKKIPFRFAEKQPAKPNGEYLLEIEADVNSPLFEIRVDKTSVSSGNAMIEVSIVRPADRALLGKKPEKTSIKKTLTLAKTPSDIKIYYRVVTTDAPGNPSYNLIAQIAPSSPAPL